MSKSLILESSAGMNCPHCDEWVRQPGDPSITIAECPSCGAEVEFPTSVVPAQSLRKSSGVMNGFLVGASAAVILGIYGYSIFNAGKTGEALLAAPVDPRVVDRPLRPSPQPDDSTTTDTTPDDELAQQDSPPVQPDPMPPVMLSIVEMLDDEDDIPSGDPPSTDAPVAEVPKPPDATTPPTDVAQLVDPTMPEAGDATPIDPTDDETLVAEPPPSDVASVADPLPADETEDATVNTGDIAPFDEEEYLKNGWKFEASEVLRGFMAARNIEERSNYVHNPELVRTVMRTVERQGNPPWKGLTPDDFTHIDLSEADRRKGIFLMLRETPDEDPAANSNRSYAFFKRTAQGLKLDFEVFAQTTGRAFQRFIDAPKPGHAEVFRVFITEDPVASQFETANSQSYVVAGLSNFSAATRIRMTSVSPVGQILAAANFTSEDGSRRVMRNATVELRWTDQPENSALEMSRFICWEFLGLGGEPLDE
jgi:hypothetical protein